MKTIKIKFTDFSMASFRAEHHWITKRLKEKYIVEYSDHPDFLFYSTWGFDFLNYPDAVRIFCGGEPISPNFNDCDYAFGFEPIVYENRYFQYPVGDSDSPGLYDVHESIQDRSAVSQDLCSRKFCNFVASQDWIGRGALLRRQFCQRVMDTYKHVDCPGFVLHNLDNAISPRWTGMACGQGHVDENWSKGKIEFLKNYKFTIAFENCSIPGLTTERMVQPFLVYSIPIYWGNPDIAGIVNPKAFINCNDYENDFDAVIEKIKYLDHHDDAYMEMLSEKPFLDSFDFDREKKAAQFLYWIIERGNFKYDKDGTMVARSTIAYREMKNKNQNFDTAGSFVRECHEGKHGMRTILQAVKGWADYKLHKNKQGI